MREFELIIDEAFKNGLSPLDRPPTNSQLLWRCLGFRCADGGLEACEEFESPLPGALSLDYVWPFPQMIVGEGYTILAEKDTNTGYIRVYKVSEDHETITQLFESRPVLYPATLLEVADFGKYIFMTTGSTMIYWDAESEVWLRVAELDNVPTMRTICNFKGQAVGGHVLSDWYNCNDKHYVWSAIGSMDFTLGKDNEAGFRRCPYGGTVYHTRRLNDTVVGYSSEGITLIYPGTSASPEYGTGATLGFGELSDIGLINSGAVAGNLRRQVYLGEDYILREITSEGIKELGYQQYMEELGDRGDDIIITYDPSKKDFYIGNSAETYLLSPQGMTEIRQHPSAVWRRNKQTYMLPDAVDDNEPYFCTCEFDMGYRGQKTIFSIESDVILGFNPEAGVDWLLDLDTWGMEYYKVTNNEGITSIIIAGHTFRFRLKFSDLIKWSKMSYLKIRYKMTDMRGMRGVYAPPPRGQ